MHCMKCYGDCFEHRRFRKREGIRQMIENALRDGDVFGEGAIAAVIFAGNADDLTIVTEIDFIPAAILTLAAVDRGVEGDAITGPESSNICACFRDNTC